LENKKNWDEHYELCKKKELEINKIKCSECDLFFDDIETMSIHYFEIHDKQNQNKTEDKNNLQKNKLEEELNINNKNNKDEKSLIEK